MFQGVSERQEAQGNTRRLKEKLRMDKDLANYWDWMQRSGKFRTVVHVTSGNILCGVIFQTWSIYHIFIW